MGKGTLPVLFSMADEEPITQSQLGFAVTLLQRIDISKLPQGLRSTVEKLKAEPLSKRQAKVVISFLIYVESVSRNKCFCDSLGVVEL
jgi:hypothetical protein